MSRFLGTLAHTDCFFESNDPCIDTFKMIVQAHQQGKIHVGATVGQRDTMIQHLFMLTTKILAKILKTLAALCCSFIVVHHWDDIF